MGAGITKTRPGKWRTALAGGLCALLPFAFVTPPGTLAAGGTSVEKVKAAYLRNFAKLVKWPDNSFSHDDSPVVIGVLGDDPFERVLDDAVEGRTAHGRALEVRRLSVADGELPPAESLTGCHLLFVSDSERDRLSLIFERLAGTHVMTVSDVENFATAGGVAEFVLSGTHIKFRFNRRASDAAGLRPSAKLLSLAIFVEPSR